MRSRTGSWTIQGSNTGDGKDWVDVYRCNADNRSGSPLRDIPRAETLLFTSFTSADMAQVVTPADARKLEAKLKGQKIGFAHFPRQTKPTRVSTPTAIRRLTRHGRPVSRSVNWNSLESRQGKSNGRLHSGTPRSLANTGDGPTSGRYLPGRSRPGSGSPGWTSFRGSLKIEGAPSWLKCAQVVVRKKA